MGGRGGGGGGKTLKFEDGAVQFRQRLVTSLLSHRPILIRNIRSDSVTAPGLHEHEASFLRLLDRLTNGSTVEINATGTQLRFKPGVLMGGEVEHDCPVGGVEDDEDEDEDANASSSSSSARGVGWYLEGLLPLAPFGKSPLHLTLTGITDGTTDMDPSPDYVAASLLPLLSRFGIGSPDNDDNADLAPSLKVTQRGASPLGGGAVQFYCPIVRNELTRPLDLIEPGKIKRVRGTVTSCKIPPSSAARAAHAAKGLLHRLLPDVWVHTDCHSSSKKRGGGGCGPSPGLGLILTAESTEGVVMSAETCLDPSKNRSGGGSEGGGAAILPEDLGIKAASLLLEEIRKGGCVDTYAQSTALLLMCLGPEDVARVRVGTLSQYTVESLRLFKRVFGIEFKVKADPETRTVVLSCLGSGYRNMAKAST